MDVDQVVREVDLTVLQELLDEVGHGKYRKNRADDRKRYTATITRHRTV